MAKNKVSEWSSTPSNNTDVGGIDIAENCAPSGINNAIREIMAQVKDMQAGTDADNFTVGGNLVVTGTTALNGQATTITQSVADNSTKIATTAFVTNKIASVSSGVTTFSAGTTGLTPSGSTSGAITLAGTLSAANGGTGKASLTANSVILGNGTSAVQEVAPSTSGNVLMSNGTTWQSTAINTLTSGTVVTASGASILVTNTIPAWAKRVTIIFNNVSANGSDNLLVQIGTSGGLVTTGYASVGAQAGTATTGNTSTSGFIISLGDPSRGFTGTMVLSLITGTTWIASYSGAITGQDRMGCGGGSVSLSGALTQIQLDWTGSNNFDSGSVNVMYE